MSIEVIEANFADATHAEHIVMLTNAYAKDAMGASAPLRAEVRESLVPGLRATPGAVTFLAYENDEPLGLANCFVAYATFKARPLLNVHDLAVLPAARGRGVGKALLDAAAAKARGLGACRVTLEVLETNPARRLYEREGFEYGTPRYLFMTRTLD
ncbi:MAG: GNAT family N-acetyltransferase [Pseudomonadota bacterium]